MHADEAVWSLSNLRHHLICCVGCTRQADSAKSTRRQDRSGGPLEFLSLLSGLTKRW